VIRNSVQQSYVILAAIDQMGLYSHDLDKPLFVSTLETHQCFVVLRSRVVSFHDFSVLKSTRGCPALVQVSQIGGDVLDCSEPGTNNGCVRLGQANAYLGAKMQIAYFVHEGFGEREVLVCDKPRFPVLLQRFQEQQGLV
jgi:hypothetical protein